MWHWGRCPRGTQCQNGGLPCHMPGLHPGIDQAVVAPSGQAISSQATWPASARRSATYRPKREGRQPGERGDRHHRTPAAARHVHGPRQPSKDPPRHWAAAAGPCVSPDTSSPPGEASSGPDCAALQGRPVKGSFAVADAMAHAPPWTVPPFQAVSGSYRMRHLYASAFGLEHHDHLLISHDRP